MKNKLVVYTALFGNYDNLLDPPEKYEGCDFICFTDQKNLKSSTWEIRKIDECDLPPNMMNRKYKILPHLFLSEYDSSVYVDTNITIKSDITKLAQGYLKNSDFLVTKHVLRDCVYQEARVNVALGKAKLKDVFNQMSCYSQFGFPKRFGLGENNIILRNHNSNTVISTMEDWWKELNTFTQRDQLSLAYVLWKNNNKFQFINESSRIENAFFSFVEHNCNHTGKFKLKKKLMFKFYYLLTYLLWKFI